MSKAVRALKARKEETLARMKALSDKAAAENRAFTEEEAKAFADDKAAVEAVNAQIEREGFLEEQATSLEVPATARVEGGAPVLLQDPKRGFKHLGEFAATVKRNARNASNPTDERLKIIAAAPTTFGSEGTGADGGFAIPPEFSRNVWTLSLGEDSLVPYCDDIPVRGNSMTFPKDETTPWGTDGVRAYWQVEAGAGTQTKPALGTRTLRLHKLMALVPVTDELLEDTDALNAYLPRKAGDSIRWKTNEGILWGNGNGQPLGALQTSQTSSPSIVVSKDSGQSTLTLSETNLSNMKGKLPPGSKRSRLWLINNDVESALLTLKTATGGYPLYYGFGGGIAAVQEADLNPADEEDYLGEPDGYVYKMPVFVSQHAKSFTSQGDVTLLDLSYYQIITKSGGGIETATSMHLYFDADATALRFLFRIDGQPKISKQISPANGSNKLSPFLQLQAR